LYNFSWGIQASVLQNLILQETFNIYFYRVVVLNSFNAIREAFKLDAFSGRPALKMLEIRNGGMVNVGKCINILNNSSHKCAHY
jgi:hypothetical protein